MCSITGYGQDGPFASRAGHDLNYMATAGALGLNGAIDGPPLPLSVQVADIGGGGLQPAVAILGALVAVGRGEPGRWIDASMMDGAVSWLALALAAQGGGEQVGRGDQRLGGRYPCYRVYTCKDGGFYSVGALEPKFWATLCDTIERPDLLAAQFAEGGDGHSAHEAMESVFLSRTRKEWEQKLAGLEVCCEPVLQLAEVAAHPQVVARGLIASTPEGVEVRPAIPLRPDWRRRAAPRLGEHTAELLAEAGVDAARLGNPQERRSRLSSGLAQRPPQAFDLRASRLPRARVVDHMGRAAALLVDRHLDGDHLAGPLGREAAPAHQTLDLDLAGDPDENGGWEQSFEFVLEQERDILHDHAGATCERLGGPRGHPLAHERVDDRVQAAARVRVCEHQLAEGLPVDTPVAHVVRAEVANHRLETRRSRLVDRVAGLVRVDDLGPELTQDCRHCRFPRTDATCESNELHHLGCCINGR